MGEFIHSGVVRFHSELEPLMRDIDTVQPAPYNYNNGDMDAITESVETSGMYRPIYAQKSTGHIIAGNHTWMACKALGATHVPIVFLDVNDVQARRIMVADNRTASLAQPDNGLLMALLDEINELDDKSLVGTGYTEADLETLHHLNEIPLDTGDDFAQWPTFSVKLPPHVLREFMFMTDAASDDRTRFELLMRKAGWDG